MTLYAQLNTLASERTEPLLRRRRWAVLSAAANDNRPEPEEWR